MPALLHQGLKVFGRHAVEGFVDLALAVLVLDGLLRLAEGAAFQLLHRPQAVTGRPRRDSVTG